MRKNFKGVRLTEKQMNWVEEQLSGSELLDFSKVIRTALDHCIDKDLQVVVVLDEPKIVDDAVPA